MKEEMTVTVHLFDGGTVKVCRMCGKILDEAHVPCDAHWIGMDDEVALSQEE